MCLVDDEQWLDHASAQVLAFVARRLGAESVGAGLRGAGRRAPSWRGCRSWRSTDLRDADARAAARRGADRADRRAGARSDRRRDAGQPAGAGGAAAGAGITAELAGGFGLPGAVPHAGRIEESFARRLDALAGPRRGGCCCSRRPNRQATRRWCGARPRGSGSVPTRRRPAAEAGLAEFGACVRFRHPLARSAAYRSAIRRWSGGRRTAPWPR